MAGLNKFASAKDQLIFVRCDPCLNTVLATKLRHRSIKLPRLSAHDLGATMGEDGAPNARCFAPAKLLDNWRVANQSPSLAKRRSRGEARQCQGHKRNKRLWPICDNRQREP
jgi:hypothetical protein